MLNILLLNAALALQTFAAPTEASVERRQAVTPQVKSATWLGNVTDPGIDRDSCNSVRIGNRAFWVCRDSMRFDVARNAAVLPVVVTTSAWTSLGSGVMKTGMKYGAASSGSDPILQMYGSGQMNPYFPLSSDMCLGNYGQCSDGTRWVNWHNTPPLVTSSTIAKVTAYSWVPKSRIAGLHLVNGPTPYSLYKTTYTVTSNKNAMPTSTLIQSEFWKGGQLGYGDYGAVTRNGYAYLYAKTGEGRGPALARVKPANVEKIASYEYYVNGAWTKTMPSLTDPGIIIQNAGDGDQGTYYYSSKFKSYIWIGRQMFDFGANFYMSTAPAPEGPWVPMYKIFSGKNGDGIVGAYSLQAHPALLPSTNAAENGIYLSYTQPWQATTCNSYTQPLLYLEFQ